MFPSILALIGAAERRAAVLRRDAETDAIDAGRHLAEADAALWQEAADEARIELAALLPESRARGVSTPSMTLIAVIVLVVLGLITVWFKVHGY